MAEEKSIFKKYNIKPQRSKGQNFLVNQGILEKIVEAAELKKEDVVLEIGPGLGVLTKELAKRVKKVVAVELDRKLVEILKEELRDFENVELVQGDVLKLETQNLELGTYKLVANLPYNITSAVLRKFLESELRPEVLVVMVQREVGERICARHGGMSLLSVSVQFYGEPKIVARVSRVSFWPVPKVDSVVLKITPKDAGNIRRLTPDFSERDFFRIVKIGFASRRKQLQNNLAVGLDKKKEEIKEVLNKLGLREDARAEDLGVEDWVGLVKMLNS